MNQTKRIMSLALLVSIGNLVAMQHENAQERRSHAAAWVVGGAVGAGAVGYGAYRAIVAHRVRSDCAFVQQQERFVQQMHEFIGNEPLLKQVTIRQQQRVLNALRARFLKESGGMHPLYCAGMYLAACLERLEKIYIRYECVKSQKNVQFIATVKRLALYESALLDIVANSQELQAEAWVHGQFNSQQLETNKQFKRGIVQKIIDVALDQAVLHFGQHA